jgi:hypothetical protein
VSLAHPSSVSSAAFPAPNSYDFANPPQGGTRETPACRRSPRQSASPLRRAARRPRTLQGW